MSQDGIKAEAFLTAISHFTLQFHTDVWRARCRALHGKTLPRTQQGVELLTQVKEMCAALSPYVPVPQQDEFLDMTTPAIRKWYRWAMHTHKRMSHKPTNLFSYYSKSTSTTIDHNLLWFTSTHHGHHSKTHSARPGPALHGKPALFTRTRPMFRPHSRQGIREPDLLTTTDRKGCTAALAAEFKANTGVTIDEYDCLLPCGMRPLHFTPLHPYLPAPYWKRYNSRMQTQHAERITSPPPRKRKRKRVGMTTTPRSSLAPAHSTIAVMLGRSLSDDQKARAIALRRKAHHDQAAKRLRLGDFPIGVKSNGIWGGKLY